MMTIRCKKIISNDPVWFRRIPEKASDNHNEFDAQKPDKGVVVPLITKLAPPFEVHYPSHAKLIASKKGSRYRRRPLKSFGLARGRQDSLADADEKKKASNADGRYRIPIKKVSISRPISNSGLFCAQSLLRCGIAARLIYLEGSLF